MKSMNRVQYQADTVAGGLNKTFDTMTGLLKHIIIDPATDTTTYDVVISDGSSLNLFERNDIAGTLNEIVEIPVNSNIMVSISDAIVNELFKIYLAVEE